MEQVCLYPDSFGLACACLDFVSLREFRRSFAGIVGTVKDPSGASLPNAVLSKATNTSARGLPGRRRRARRGDYSF